MGKGSSRRKEDREAIAKNWDNNFVLRQELTSHKILIESRPEEKEYIETASLRSDVDINIPINNTVDENKFALIIGNEDYSSFQQGLSSEMNVTYAINDASIFKEYCLKTLGVSSKNIIYLVNATVGKMSQSIDKIKNLISIIRCNKIIALFVLHKCLNILNSNWNILHQILITCLCNPEIIFNSDSHLFFLNIDTWLNCKYHSRFYWRSSGPQIMNINS